MEANAVEELPGDPGWQYEPKWDGFRAIVVKDGDAVCICSKSVKPLGRHFPEIEVMVAGLGEDRLVLDGELIIPIGDALSFDALQARLHPAASRVDRLTRETPAHLTVFDCLRIGKTDLTDRPLSARLKTLVRLHDSIGRVDLPLLPASTFVENARREWRRAAARSTAWSGDQAREGRNGERFAPARII